MLVSVIIPVYNAERFLKKSIESVINQSYKNIELILINDGSTDSSKTICDQYAFADGRIKVISQKNKGPAGARNTGLGQATGKFVFFLDTDDFIEKNAIKTLVDNYDQSHPDLVMGNFSKLENDGEAITQSVSFHPDGEPFAGQIKRLSKKDIVNYVRHFLKHPSNHLISYCWARLYKLSIIKKHGIVANEKMRLFEDFVFNLDYLKHTNKVVFVNKPIHTYTIYRDHVSASMAIVNGDSLLHDMNIFKTGASKFLRQASGSKMSALDIKKEIGHALVHYVIIFFVRSCRQITMDNKKIIANEISKVVKAPILKDSLPYYSPARGRSRILPLLMKLKLVSLIMPVCQHKAYKRYGKLKDN